MTDPGPAATAPAGAAPSPAGGVDLPGASAGEGRRTPRQQLAAALYLGFARHLPWSPRPGGAQATRLRRALALQMLDACGTEVNVEHGAWFGSGRGIRLGDRSALGMDALIIGPLHVGNDVMMGPRCVFLASSHETSDVTETMNQQGFAQDRPIVVEDDVWIGANVVVLPGRRLGRGSIVGAGAVVSKDVPPYTIAAGNPAVVVRERVRPGAGAAADESRR